MRRIPSFDGRKVADHLVPTTRVGITQYGKPTFLDTGALSTAPNDAGTVLRDILLAFGPVTDLTPDDFAFFGARIWQILTSCQQRRLAEYERIELVGVRRCRAALASYQKFLADGITRSLVAAKARKASTRTIGDMFVQLMLTILDPTGGSTDRVLDGPTNLVWIDPWRSYLESRGVRYVTEAEVEEILCDKGRITGVAIRQTGKRTSWWATIMWPRCPLERIAPHVERPAAGRGPGARQPARAGRRMWSG